ncbi:MAG: glycosyltransferase family 39 protein [Anaerolineae bacterium]|nr:glycosyltransferase family 39 protein [Anaerolineae bacterium]
MSQLKLLRSHWPFLVLLVLVSLVLLVRLDRSPAPWYDEGLNINAAQTFAETGQYGLRSGSELRRADPAIQTGPPLIVLLAALDRSFDGSMALMRLPSVIFGLLLLLGFYRLVFRLYGDFAAFMACLGLVLLPGESTVNFVFLSRQVMGEIFALVCLVVGLRILMYSGVHLNAIRALFVGIFWAVAIMLKSQVLLVLTVTCVLIGLYHFLRRSDDWLRWMLIGVVMVGSYLLDMIWQIRMAGPLFGPNSAVLRDGILIHILPMRALQTLTEPDALIRIGAMLAPLLVMIFIRRRIEPSQGSPGEIRTETFTWLFVVVWAVWFGVVSIGWRRYAFVGQVIGLIPLAFLIDYLWRRLRLPQTQWVYAGLLVTGVVAGGILYAPRITDQSGDHFFEAVNYINQELPRSSRIVSWEWSASYFTRQEFQFPHTQDVNALTRAAFLSQSAEAKFDPLAGCPQYILLGSFDLDRTIFQPALDIAQPEPLFEAGQYKIYAIPSERLQLDTTTGQCRVADT